MKFLSSKLGCSYLDKLHLLRISALDCWQHVLELYVIVSGQLCAHLLVGINHRIVEWRIGWAQGAVGAGLVQVLPAELVRHGLSVVVAQGYLGLWGLFVLQGMLVVKLGEGGSSEGLLVILSITGLPWLVVLLGLGHASLHVVVVSSLAGDAASSRSVGAASVVSPLVASGSPGASSPWRSVPLSGPSLASRDASGFPSRDGSRGSSDSLLDALLLLLQLPDVLFFLGDVLLFCGLGFCLSGLSQLFIDLNHFLGFFLLSFLGWYDGFGWRALAPDLGKTWLGLLKWGEEQLPLNKSLLLLGFQLI